MFKWWSLWWNFVSTQNDDNDDGDDDDVLCASWYWQSITFLPSSLRQKIARAPATNASSPVMGQHCVLPFREFTRSASPTQLCAVLLRQLRAFHFFHLEKVAPESLLYFILLFIIIYCVVDIMHSIIIIIWFYAAILVN